MTDRVHPSSNSNPKPPPPAATTAITNGVAATTNKPPQFRHPYRPKPPPYQPRRHHKRRGICCRCCFWTILILLILLLLAGIAGTALYVLNRPQQPQFVISSLRISKLNLTTSSDSSSSHISSFLNLTLTSRNPNSHLTFFYDPFVLSYFSGDGSDVFIANASLPSYTSNPKNETVLRAVLSGSEDLDAESVTALRSDLWKRNGVPMKIQMDTKVAVKMGGFRSDKVGIRVTCHGIKGSVPKGKLPSVSSVSGSKCKVDLRIKIWKLTV